MDWCVKPFDQANHNPVAVVNGDATKSILYLKAKPGEKIVLQAKDSYDPDGDNLTFLWWVYKEAGTYEGDVEIVGYADPNVLVMVPGNAAGKEIHVILTLKDAGDPPLYAYRRVVLNIA